MYMYQYGEHMVNTENKLMKRGYSKILYHQERNKDETIISVTKRLFGEQIKITSRLVRTQNRELSFRCIAYNMHRLTNLIIIINGFYRAPPVGLLGIDQRSSYDSSTRELVFIDEQSVLTGQGINPLTVCCT
jgi:hypothetical protein